jgi:hypothetical protein
VIYDYAVDPALFGTWQDLRLWYDKFGMDQGRLISDYPKDWERAVWAGAKDNVRRLSTREQLYYAERLKELRDGALVKRPDAAWDQRLGWLTNAQREHARRAFHAVLIKGGHPGNESIWQGDRVLDDPPPRFRARGGLPVPRTPDEFARVLAPLLRMSSQIVFVDRYLTLHLPDSRRRYAIVEAVMRLLAKERNRLPGLTFEIQTEFRGVPRDLPLPDKAQSQDHLSAIFGRMLPRGSQAELYRLLSLPDGDRIHNRYVLTEVGGVIFGKGLDVGDGESETDDLNRLSPEQYKRRWTQYYLGRRPDQTHTLLGRIP